MFLESSTHASHLTEVCISRHIAGLVRTCTIDTLFGYTSHQTSIHAGQLVPGGPACSHSTQVPFLVDNESDGEPFCVSEACAVLTYLARRYSTAAGVATSTTTGSTAAVRPGLPQGLLPAHQEPRPMSPVRAGTEQQQLGLMEAGGGSGGAGSDKERHSASSSSSSSTGGSSSKRAVGVPDHWYPSELRAKTRVDAALHWQHRGLRQVVLSNTEIWY